MITLPNNFKLRKASNSGQALLIVLLSMAVVLTIILSILSRSVTDIAITSREEEALRAFSAAEAGVERALIVGADVSGNLEDASFTAQVTGLATGGKEYVYPTDLLSGETAVFWFVEHDEDTGELTCSSGNCFTGSQMKFCWGEPGTPSDSSTTPALEMSIFYAATPGDYSTVKIARTAHDPNATRRTTNGFQADGTGATCVIEDKEFAFQQTINFDDFGIPASSYNNQNGLQFAKMRMFYNTDQEHEVGLDIDFAGNSLLPSQGLRINSTGSFGESNRRIEVFQTFGELPPIFDAAVFSPGGLVK